MGTASPLLVVVWCFIAHQGLNALLLSPINPLRCVYWNRKACDVDESWVCNWFSFSHLHVSVLLSCLAIHTKETGTKSQSALEATLAYLCSVIAAIHIALYWYFWDSLHLPIVGVQLIEYLFILGAMWYYINKLDIDMNYIVAGTWRTITTTNIAMGLEVLASMFRFGDMAFGSGQKSYLGDMSSPSYQCISDMAICDMGLVVLILAFALRYCTVAQKQNVLYGQALALLLSQVMLSSTQGEMIETQMAKTGIVVTFILIVIALVGSFC